MVCDERDDYIAKSININREDLLAEYLRVAPDLAYFTTLFARASESLAIAELNREVEEAKLYIKCRDMLGGPQGKSPTEATVLAHVRADPTYLSVRTLEIVAKKEADFIKSTCAAITAKKSVLVSLCCCLQSVSEPVSVGAQKESEIDLKETTIKY